MKTRFAGCHLTSTGTTAYSGSRMARKGIAVLAVRTAMCIVIFTQIFFISPGRLLADVVAALFICARSGGTNLLDGAGLTSIAINTARRAALGIGALLLQRVQAETALARLGDTFRILTIPCLPAGELGAVIGFRTA